MGEGGPAMSGWLYEKPLTDAAIRTTIDLSGAMRAGVVFRVATVERDRPRVMGLAVCVNRARGVIQLCEAELESRRSVQLKPLDTVYGCAADTAKVEVWMRAEYVEVYVDDRALFSLNAEEYALEGKAGFFVEGGSAVFDSPTVYAITAPLRGDE